MILDSRKPEAKKFRRWVTNEVLPQIRKSGTYISDRVLDSEDPLDMLEQALTIAREERGKRQELERQAEINRPKLAAHGERLPAA